MKRRRYYKYKSINGKSHLAHRLIWERAYGKIPKGYEIHHKNGKPQDNRLLNLLLVTHLVHNRLHSPAYRLLPDGNPAGGGTPPTLRSGQALSLRWLKRCAGCLRVKPLDNFYRVNHPSSKEYHLRLCKTCHKLYMRTLYQKRKGVIKHAG